MTIAHDPRFRPAILSLAAGAITFVLGAVTERAVVAAVHADPTDLGWISDVILTLGLTAVSYLWLHLRATERRLSDLERARIGMDTQMRLAAEIQRNLLPELPERTGNYRWAARLLPTWAVGGDFYDLVARPDGASMLIVGDISGKGVPAALLHASLRAMFRSAARGSSDPAAIAARLSEALYADNAGVPYATAFIGRLDAEPPRLTYVNAGHPAAVLLRGGRGRALGSTSPPLGLLPGTAFAPSEIGLEPGDVGVVVTDGVTDALEGSSDTVTGVLDGGGGSMLTPASACDLLIEAAAAGPGPVGVSGWHDDSTVVAFELVA